MHAVNFNSWADFKPYGINFLTGESCAYSMRLLCDLSATGAETIRQFLGLPVGSALAENWNSRVGEAEAVASIHLPKGMFAELARFISFNVVKARHVVEFPDGSIHAYPDGYIEQHGMTVDQARDRLPGKWYTNFADLGRSIGGRNVHAMSGRTL